MKRVYFVRHGESESNVTEVVQGLHDVLTPKGESQALSIARRAENLTFDALLSSDAVRTTETAEAIGKVKGMPIEFSPLFREAKRPSSIIGFSWKTPEYVEHLRLEREHWNEPEWRMEDEENCSDLILRARNAIAHIESHEKETLMVVTHGRFMRYIVAVLTMGDALTPEIMRGFEETFRMANTGITVCFTRADTGRWQVLTWNDYAHFAE